MLKVIASGTIASDATVLQRTSDFKISFSVAAYSSRRDEGDTEPIKVSIYTKNKEVAEKLRAGRIITLEGTPKGRIERDAASSRKAVVEIHATGYELLEPTSPMS